MIGVNEMFPSFEKNGVDGDELVTKSSSDYTGWRVFYFYPKDFTFICPTEIVAMDKLLEEASVAGFSGDNEFCKKAWKESDDALGKIKHTPVSYTHLRAHETREDLVCRLLLEKKK